MSDRCHGLPGRLSPQHRGRAPWPRSPSPAVGASSSRCAVAFSSVLGGWVQRGAGGDATHQRRTLPTPVPSGISGLPGPWRVSGRRASLVPGCFSRLWVRSCWWG